MFADASFTKSSDINVDDVDAGMIDVADIADVVLSGTELVMSTATVVFAVPILLDEFIVVAVAAAILSRSVFSSFPTAPTLPPSSASLLAPPAETAAPFSPFLTTVAAETSKDCKADDGCCGVGEGLEFPDEDVVSVAVVDVIVVIDEMTVGEVGLSYFFSQSMTCSKFDLTTASLNPAAVLNASISSLSFCKSCAEGMGGTTCCDVDVEGRVGEFAGCNAVIEGVVDVAVEEVGEIGLAM